jgi:hypothetical protein
VTMRYLNLFRKDNEKAEQFYSMIYDGVILNPEGYKGFQNSHLAHKVLYAFEKVGVPVVLETGGSKIDTYRLNEEGGMVELEDAEYAFLQGVLGSTVWMGTGVHRVEYLKLWLNNATFTREG